MLKDYSSSWYVHNQIFDEIYEFQFNPYYFRLISISEDTNILIFDMIMNYILILRVAWSKNVKYQKLSFNPLGCLRNPLINNNYLYSINGFPEPKIQNASSEVLVWNEFIVLF